MPQPGLSLKSRFSLDPSLWTQLQGLIISRMLRAAAIQRGRSGPTQRFSKSKEADPVLEHLLVETLNPEIHSARRVQLLFDRTRVVAVEAQAGNPQDSSSLDSEDKPAHQVMSWVGLSGHPVSL